MKICFTVQVNEGLASDAYAHLGSAPILVVVNTDTDEATTINNSGQIHKNGSFNPIDELGGQRVDAIVVDWIDRGTLHKLKISGLRVVQVQQGNIDENMELFVTDDLPEFMSWHSCGGHGHDYECSH